MLNNPGVHNMRALPGNIFQVKDINQMTIKIEGKHANVSSDIKRFFFKLNFQKKLTLLTGLPPQMGSPNLNLTRLFRIIKYLP